MLILRKILCGKKLFPVVAFIGQPLVFSIENKSLSFLLLRPFSLDEFHDYEKHFTVMNYQEPFRLKHIESVEFVPLFKAQYPQHPWASVQEAIFQMLRELFLAVCRKDPPAGLAHSPQVFWQESHKDCPWFS